MSIAAEPSPIVETGERRKRWTTEEFDRLVSAGFLDEGSRAYLWDGEIIEPMAENPPHINAVANLYRLLLILVDPTAWTVNQNAPVALDEGYKPQPDLVVLRGPRERYRLPVPTAADVALIVEVSDSTYAKDSGPYLRKYAEVGIPVYGIVNIPLRRVEIYEEPDQDASGVWSYPRVRHFGLSDEVPLRLIDAQGAVVDAGRLLVGEILRDSLDLNEAGEQP